MLLCQCAKHKLHYWQTTWVIAFLKNLQLYLDGGNNRFCGFINRYSSEFSNAFNNPHQIFAQPSPACWLCFLWDSAVFQSGANDSHRSATVWCRMSPAVDDSVTVQAITSLAMAPKQRLIVLPSDLFLEKKDAFFCKRLGRF